MYLFFHSGLGFCINIITKFNLDMMFFFLEPFEVECFFCNYPRMLLSAGLSIFQTKSSDKLQNTFIVLPPGAPWSALNFGKRARECLDNCLGISGDLGRVLLGCSESQTLLPKKQNTASM